MMNLPKSVTICEDVTRDGFQCTPFLVAAEDKVQIIEMATKAGVRSFEVGAFAPNSESMKMMWNTGEVFQKSKQQDGISYRALIFDEDGVNEAHEYGCSKVKINISASDAHHQRGTGMTTQTALKGFSKIARTADDYKIAMCGSISLPFVSPFQGEGIIRQELVADIIKGFQDIGINEISFSDAGGLGNPALIYNRISALTEQFPNMIWTLHMHNTWGMGLAGVLAALQAGVKRFDASLAGLGGCPYLPGASGNVATEDLVFMLEQMGIETGIDLEQLIPVGRYVRSVSKDTGWDSVMQRNKEKSA